MLNEGHWETSKYDRWQSSGCKNKMYKKNDLYECLNNKTVIYVGDSIMREQYYAMTQFFRPGRPSQEAIHADQQVIIQEHNITIEMWWDPFLNTNRTLRLLQGQEPGPTLLIMDTGVWYMKDFGSRYLQEWKKTVDRVFDGVQQYAIADKVMLSPVEVVEYDRLSPSRKQSMTYDKIQLMNKYLRERESTLEDPVTPLAIPFVWNEIITSSKNQTLDGLHFQPPVTKAQAQLALNYLCNEQLQEKTPLGLTCCHSSRYLTFVLLSSLCLMGLIAFILFSYRMKLLEILYAIKPQLKI
jgi:hypothetical protein